MKVQNKILKSAELILVAMGLSAVSAAQVTPGNGRNPVGGGNLENDIHTGPSSASGHGSAYAGPVFDGGSVFVDIGVQEALELSIETMALGGPDPIGVRPPKQHKKIRLAGGAPGNAGMILVNPNAPDKKSRRLASNSSMITGVFGIDGSIVVDLPELADEVFVQGVEVTPIGGAYSGIRKIVPPGQLVDPLGLTWDAQAISDAVRGATRDMGDELFSLRFFGAARMAGLDRSVDVTVVLGREPAGGKGGFTLALDPTLAQRTVLVDLDDDDGAVFHFQSMEELSDAIQAVIVLDAFANVDMELAAATAQLEALRARPGQDIGRCGTPRRPGLPGKKTSGRYTGPIDDAGSVTVAVPEKLVLDTLWEVLGQIAAPKRAGDKKPALPTKSGGARYNGQIGDAGAVVVDLTGSEESATFSKLGRLDDPRRAGDKKPAVARKSGAGRYSGAIGDAGERTAHLKSELDSFDKARRMVGSLGSASRTVDLLRHKLGSGGHTR